MASEAVVVVAPSAASRRGLYYSVRRYAERHGLKPDTVRRWCRSGKLEAIRVVYWLVWDPAERSE